MKRMFWITLSMVFLATLSSKAVLAQATGANFSGGVGFSNPPAQGSGGNQVGVTLTEKILVQEQAVIDHAREYCAQIGKAEECEQAFREYAFGEDNPFGCLLSLLIQGSPNDPKQYLCDQDEAAIESACERRLSGLPTLGGRLVRPDRDLNLHRVVAVPAPEEDRRYYDPQDIQRNIIDRAGVAHRFFVPSATGNEDEVDSGEVAAENPAQPEGIVAAPASAIQGAGCTLNPALEGWEFSNMIWMLSLGLAPLLGFSRGRD